MALHKQLIFSFIQIVEASERPQQHSEPKILSSDVGSDYCFSKMLLITTSSLDL